VTPTALLRAIPRFVVLFLLTACHGPALKSAAGAGATRSYPASGVIERISADRHLVTIHHHDIPGYMMEMTMDFPVREAHLLDGLVPGDQVDFTLMVANDDAWVAAVQRTGHIDLPATNTMARVAAPGLKAGDSIPNAEFIAEDGRLVHLSDFHGKVVAFTFFFTRCPLPNYCPLMNRNLAQARELLRSQPDAPKNWQFLSISFDSEFDTPRTLSGYADFYRKHDADRWLFVAATPETLARFATPLGLVLMRQDNSISHNLRTVVVDPQGRLFRRFNDNLWTPEQLAQTVRDAARS
jgi:protein SCO1/2